MCFCLVWSRDQFDDLDALLTGADNKESCCCSNLLVTDSTRAALMTRKISKQETDINSSC